jgi:hypothetical protein
VEPLLWAVIVIETLLFLVCALELRDTRRSLGESSPADNRADRSMVRWTRVVGLFTASLAVVAGLQFWAFVQTERAFLSVVSLTIDGGLPEIGNQSVRVFFQVKNSGRSTGFPSRSVLVMGFGPRPSKPVYGDEPQVAALPVPAADVANDQDVIVLSRPLSTADVEGVKSGSIRMSVFGYISYSDTFWFFGNRTTGFCFNYTPLPTGASQFETCPERDYTYVN